MPSKINLEVIVDILTKLGKLDESKLVNSITGRLRKIELKDIGLSPDVKLDPATKTQLDSALKSLGDIMSVRANTLKGQSARLTNDIVKPYKQLPQKIRAAIQGAFNNITPANAGRLADALPSIGKNIDSRAVTDLGVAHKEYNKQIGQGSLLLRQFFRFAIGYQSLFAALNAVKALTKGVVDLNQSLKTVQAISRATSEEMDSISRSITNVALETKFGLNDIAEASKVLAQAGVKPEDFDSTLSAVATFATATNSAIDLAADLQTTMRNVFTELDDRGISNVLTKAINISKLTASDLKTILSLGAQVSKSNNLSADQFLAAVTVQRNAGIKASTVATGTRQALLEIFSPDTKLTKALVERYKQLGEDMSESAIKSLFRGFRQADNPLVAALNELRRVGLGGAGEATLSRAIDRRAENSVRALIAGVEDLQTASAELTFGESASIAAKIELTGLSASYDNLKASITAFAEQISGNFIGSLENMSDGLTNIISNLVTMDDRLKAIDLPGFASTAESAFSGGVLGLILGKGIKGKVLGGLGGALAGGFADIKGQQEGINTEILSAGLQAGATAALILPVFGKLTGIFKSMAESLSGVTKTGNKILGSGAFKALFKRGVGGLFGPVGLVVSVLGGALISFVSSSKKDVESIDTKIKSLQNLQAQAVDEFNKASIDIEQFTLPKGNKAAKPGTTAANLENLQSSISTLEERAEAFFGQNIKPEDLTRINDILSNLGTIAPEAGSQIRIQLENELVEISGFQGDIRSSDNQQELSNLQLLASGISRSSSAFISEFQIQLQQIRDLQDGGDLDPGSIESTFLNAFDAISDTSREILRGLAPDADAQELEAAFSEFLNVSTFLAQDSLNSLLEEKTSQSKSITNSLADKVATSNGDRELDAILDKYLQNIDLLTESGVTFIEGLLDSINEAIVDLEQERKVKFDPNFEALTTDDKSARKNADPAEFRLLTEQIGTLSNAFQEVLLRQEAKQSEATDKQIEFLTRASALFEANKETFNSQAFKDFIAGGSNSADAQAAFARLRSGGGEERTLVIKGDGGAFENSRDFDLEIQKIKEFNTNRLSEEVQAKEELVNVTQTLVDERLSILANEKIIQKTFLKEIDAEIKASSELRRSAAEKEIGFRLNLQKQLNNANVAAEKEATAQQIEAVRQRFASLKAEAEKQRNQPGLNSDQRKIISQRLANLRDEEQVQIKRLQNLSQEREEAVRTSEALDRLAAARKAVQEFSELQGDGLETEKIKSDFAEIEKLINSAVSEANQLPASNRIGLIEELTQEYNKATEAQKRLSDESTKALRKQRSEVNENITNIDQNETALTSIQKSLKEVDTLREAVQLASDVVENAPPINFDASEVSNAIVSLQDVLNQLSKISQTTTFIDIIERRTVAPIARKEGGPIFKARVGRQVPGFGGGDRVSALLEPGEFVINKESTRKYGALIRAINAGTNVGEAAAQALASAPVRAIGTETADSGVPVEGASDVVRVEFPLGSRQPTLFGHRDQVDSLVQALREVGTGEVG